jgi:hypothetical protein
MQVPQWQKNGQNTFWRRHYEPATITEQACEQAIEQRSLACSSPIGIIETK